MNHYSWEQSFRDLFHRCCQAYISGQRDWTQYYSFEDRAFLSSIGCQPREFFDFVEDNCDTEDGEEPTYETALLVAAVRRDYFLHVQGGVLSKETIDSTGLPSAEEELGGYAWLPRLIVKAKAKLLGQLDPDIMYGCGGDRRFLSSVNIHPADFLRMVWSVMSTDQEDLLILEAMETMKQANVATQQ